jgi:hypothetical protein
MGQVVRVDAVQHPVAGRQKHRPAEPVSPAAEQKLGNEEKTSVVYVILAVEQFSIGPKSAPAPPNKRK